MQKNQIILEQQYHKHEQQRTHYGNTLSVFFAFYVVFALPNICSGFSNSHPCTLTNQLRISCCPYSDCANKDANLADDYPSHCGLYGQSAVLFRRSLFVGAWRLHRAFHQLSVDEQHSKSCHASSLASCKQKQGDNRCRQQLLPNLELSLSSSYEQLYKVNLMRKEENKNYVTGPERKNGGRGTHP